MNIPNVQAFVQFIRSNNLTGLCGEAAAACACMDEFSRMCGGCGQRAAMNSKKSTCVQHYIIFASKAASFKRQLFAVTGGTTITFYDEQRYLGCINR